LIVIDASALADLLLRTERAGWIEAQLEAPIATVQLCHLEVLSVVRRKEHRRELTARRAREVMDDLVAIPLSVYDVRPLLPRVFDLRHSLSAYDAAYVALAEGLGVPLVTSDARLGRASGHNAEIRAPGSV
jgi:predicted nucleic acid-binding protein